MSLPMMVEFVRIVKTNNPVTSGPQRNRVEWMYKLSMLRRC